VTDKELDKNAARWRTPSKYGWSVQWQPRYAFGAGVFAGGAGGGRTGR